MNLKKVLFTNYFLPWYNNLLIYTFPLSFQLKEKKLQNMHHESLKKIITFVCTSLSLEFRASTFSFSNNLSLIFYQGLLFILNICKGTHDERLLLIASYVSRTF